MSNPPATILGMSTFISVPVQGSISWVPQLPRMSLWVSMVTASSWMARAWATSSSSERSCPSCPVSGPQFDRRGTKRSKARRPKRAEWIMTPSEGGAGWIREAARRLPGRIVHGHSRPRTLPAQPPAGSRRSSASAARVALFRESRTFPGPGPPCPPQADGGSSGAGIPRQWGAGYV